MTGSTYLEFDTALNKGMKLIKEEKHKNFGLLIITAINLGLRISDLLTLTFEQLRKESFEIVEGKTGKRRKLTVNSNIKNALKHFTDEPDNFYCFRSQKNSVYSTQQINRLMKEHFNGGRKYTSHSLRKAFGRRVWENDNGSERSLVYLNELFNHVTIKQTKVYLGIRQEELDNIYLNL
ncbi:tyrosine-type recombinase/integrase [Galbibacter pacificus]|uniref:Tyrosine-type recombinase/integrase n=1 Tax=Galbibacter pacificus TaxID=2996052 RepID=A0ABT6FQE5_9FLAO|nr:tyrosine-type recombinase/integrase [Galbibacter pacificus]MDG3582038.1 tyrosine-type recombinase/integrase [Galbibacter pacificus]MDG3585488.1 tyrosine-type recombinase/integrase [Galbibacter pacificus]